MSKNRQKCHFQLHKKFIAPIWICICSLKYSDNKTKHPVAYPSHETSNKVNQTDRIRWGAQHPSKIFSTHNSIRYLSVTVCHISDCYSITSKQFRMDLFTIHAHVSLECCYWIVGSFFSFSKQRWKKDTKTKKPDISLDHTVFSHSHRYLSKKTTTTELVYNWDR